MENSMNKVYSEDELYKSLMEIWSNGLPKGCGIGLSEVDSLIRWELGRLSVITGVPNYGKSEFLDFINLRLNLNNGWKTLYFSPENYPVGQHIEKLASKVVNKEFSKNNVSENEFISTFNFIKSNFFFMNFENVNTIDDILNIALDYIAQKDIKILVIDPFNRLEHQRQSNLTETEYISKLLDRLGNFAKKYNILIHLVAHPRKMTKNKDGAFEIPNYYDINGSANFANKADYCLAVHRDFINEDTIIDVQKVKFKNLGCIGDCRLKYHISSGNFYQEDMEEITNMNFNVSNNSINNNENVTDLKAQLNQIECKIYNTHCNDENNTMHFEFAKEDADKRKVNNNLYNSEYCIYFEKLLKDNNVRYGKSINSTNVLDKVVSYFNNAIDNVPKKINLLEFLTTNRTNIDLDKLRKSTTYKEDKRMLPAITVSAKFDTVRDSKTPYTHSNLLCIDIDLKKDENDNKGNDLSVIKQVPTLLKNNNNIAYLGHSASGKGYICIIPISNSELHRDHFRALQEDFKSLGIVIDPSCIDVSRLRFYCYDKDAYFNPYATVYTSTKSKEIKEYNTEYTKIDITDKELLKIISHIENNHIDIAPTYKEFSELSYAINYEFGEDGRDLFHRICKQYKGYNGNDVDQQYDSAIGYNYDAYSIKTLYYYYNEYKPK